MVGMEYTVNEKIMVVLCDRYCRYSNGDARTQEELDRECERCTIHKALIGGEEINFDNYL